MGELRIHRVHPFNGSVCAGCGRPATFRIVAEDLRTGEKVYEAHLCEACLARKFVAMRPYIARTRPRFFDLLVAQGVL